MILSLDINKLRIRNVPHKNHHSGTISKYFRHHRFLQNLKLILILKNRRPHYLKSCRTFSYPLECRQVSMLFGLSETSR